MATVEYECSEIVSIMVGISERAQHELRIFEIPIPKGMKLQIEGEWVHRGDDGEESYQSKDFNQFTSKLKISFKPGHPYNG